ncbi:hypothetical protein KKA85_10755, partial [bacterium]|nr:hypothetical protein [bacterium]
MTDAYDLIAGPGRLRLYKLNTGWKRDRRVEVRDPSSTLLARSRFPADGDVLDIEGLPDDRECAVYIRHGNPLKRLIARPEILRATPAPRRLRALISGSGRCGTVSLARYLDGLRYRDGADCAARHETLWEHILPLLAAGDRAAVGAFIAGFVHHIEAAPHFSLVPELIAADRVVHLIRDGRRVVQSGLNRGWYRKDTPWNSIKPDFPGDPFAQCCRFWDHTNRNMAGVAQITVRLEDLAASAEALAGLVEALDLAPTDKPFPLANTGKQASTFGHWSDGEREVFAEI